MRQLLFIIILTLSGNLFAEQVLLRNVRIWVAPDNTRIVFDASGPIKYRLSRFADPQRLVIDLPNTDMSQAVIRNFEQSVRANQYLQKIRSAKRNKTDLRIVFDLQNNVADKSFVLSPSDQYDHRLVVDLYDSKARQTEEPFIGHVTKQRSTDIIIAIDAGHGGDDPGAIGRRGLREKDITLNIAKRLADRINTQPGMRAIMIRKGDYFLRLSKRIKEARKHSADMFVSIHADAFKDSKVRGSSVYILSNKGASSAAAKVLAEKENASDLIGGVSLDDKDNVVASVLLDLSQTGALQASMDVADRVLGSLKRVGRTHKKRVQSAGFAVLKAPDIPSILVEVAYISNPEEEKKLKSAKYQKKLATAIMNGLQEYFLHNPLAGTLLAMQTPRKYQIERGDTLSEIAQRYNTNPSTLRFFNQLQNDKIRVGQVLKIPAI